MRTLLSLGAVGLTMLVLPLPAIAQSLIVPDDTLGEEQSLVFESFGGLPVEVIAGGAQRGQNLFHSFSEFNVDEGRGAFFFSPEGLENIFSRVTGGNASNILGTLGTFGDAAPDLYLMNPNGILFGPSSSLEVEGSFAAVTADGIQFGEQGAFSAIAPEAPSDLLTIDPSAFLFNQIPTGDIVSQSILGLEVPDRHSLILLGGNVTIDGGASPTPNGASARSGRIDLGGLAATGAVELTVNEDTLALTFPQGVTRSDVSITSNADVLTIGDGQGDIAITGRNVEISQESSLFAGIDSGLGGFDSQAGDIVIDATGELTVADSSSVGNIVAAGGTGSSGNIQISATSINLLRGSVIAAASLGEGDAGNVSLEASDTLEISGINANGTVSSILSSVISFEEVGLPEAVGVGDGGDISIASRQLVMADGAQIASSTLFTSANAGDVEVIATDSVSLNGNSTRIQAVTTGQGSGGDITIATGTIELLNGAGLAASTLGEGDAGNVTVAATERATFAGISEDAQFPTIVSSQVLETGVGAGGDVNITTAVLEVLGGAQLSASTEGQGDAGNVIVNATERATFSGAARIGDGQVPSAALSTVTETGVGAGGDVNITTAVFEVLDGAQLQASTEGQGDAGSVSINATESVTFAGTNEDERFPSAALSTVEATGVGIGGDVNITTAVLEVLGGAQLRANTEGQGDAGSIIINATERTTFTGTSASGQISSSAFSTVEAAGVGAGGNIDITTATLEVQDGAALLANTLGQGDAGSVIINAAERVTFAGTSKDGQVASSALSAVGPTGVGSGGDITITTTVLDVLGGAQLLASTFGQGDAGSIILTASERATFAGTRRNRDGSSAASSQVAETGVGSGGDITVTTARLDVVGGAQLSASTFGQGDAGNIILNATERATFAGTSEDSLAVSGASSQVAETGVGGGGDIAVTTARLDVLGGAQLSANTLGQGDAGNIILSVSDRITLSGTSEDGQAPSAALSTVEETGVGAGGDIDISTATLELRGGAGLAASTFGQGDAGSVIINATQSTTLSGVSEIGGSSAILTNTTARSSGQGGPVRITTPTLSLSQGAIINARTGNSAQGGTIRADADVLSLTSGGQIITTTLGPGEAGNIVLNADQISFSGSDPTFAARSEAFPDVTANEGSGQSGLFTSTREASTGPGGNITLNAEDLTLSDRALISAQSEGTGTAGNILIDVSDALSLTDSDITTAATQSSGGDILINTTLDGEDALITIGGDSDITTNSLGDGGNITIGGSAVLATDDSDIISSSGAATGGNITLTRFFSEPTPPGSALDFDNNDQVDVNASGAVASGTITAPDTSFIQNSLADLPEGVINTESLIANSCVVRNEDGSSTFNITGAQGLRDRPGSTTTGYPTGEVQPLPQDQSWQPGDPIIEPQGVYQLPNGELVLSHACR